jgi:hypothetical protein
MSDVEARLTAALTGRYEVEGELGHGAMLRNGSNCSYAAQQNCRPLGRSKTQIEV